MRAWTTRPLRRARRKTVGGAEDCCEKPGRVCPTVNRCLLPFLGVVGLECVVPRVKRPLSNPCIHLLRSVSSASSGWDCPESPPLSAEEGMTPSFFGIIISSSCGAELLGGGGESERQASDWMCVLVKAASSCPRSLRGRSLPSRCTEPTPTWNWASALLAGRRRRSSTL